MNEDELIFIHKGSGLFTLGEKEYQVNTGAVMIVPKGVWHGLQNTGIENIEMRMAFTPSSFEGFLEKLERPWEKLLYKRPWRKEEQLQKNGVWYIKSSISTI
jgi:hypothetical protein